MQELYRNAEDFMKVGVYFMFRIENETMLKDYLKDLQYEIKTERAKKLMKYFDTNDRISEKHKKLIKIIRKPNELKKAKKLFMEIHEELHLPDIFADLELHEYSAIPTKKDENIAWVLWHLSRIEDMTMSILAARGEQLFDKQWQKKLNTGFVDAGLTWSYEDIVKFNREINIMELHAYRNAVGRRTREIVAKLSADDMLRKVTPEDIEKVRIFEKNEPLLAYWGSKDVAGLFLMPPTRHLIFHLNECVKYKEYIRSGKKIYIN